eukprot:GHRR01035990.1.p1 GENE.GHRR01035990.1~~GHRR01035990.1.p1  ORF type:complete len:131 (-),score=15.86 GHRR01035990.1:230-622(-)
MHASQTKLPAYTGDVVSCAEHAAVPWVWSPWVPALTAINNSITRHKHTCKLDESLLPCYMHVACCHDKTYVQLFPSGVLIASRTLGVLLNLGHARAMSRICCFMQTGGVLLWLHTTLVPSTGANPASGSH